MRRSHEYSDRGPHHVILEASSHALAQKRMAGIAFDVAVFTNLTRDHLDYHQDMESYFSAKKLLFTEYMKSSGTAVVVMDGMSDKEDYGRRLAAELSGVSVLTVGFGEDCAIRAKKCTQGINGISCEFIFGQRVRKISSNMTGSYNVLNMLAAAGAARGLNIPAEQIVAGLLRVGQVPGRLERVTLPGLPEREMPSVFVDYAHTPDGLEKVLSTMKTMTRGRLICIFGCGGDRDAGKRTLMGEVAGRLCDVVILTSDNPRTENPMDIIEETLCGVQEAGMAKRSVAELFDMDAPLNGFSVESDRKRSIHLACSLSDRGDVVLIAGKGHEQYQIIGREKQFFDDRIEAQNGLAAWTVQHLEQALNAQCIGGKRARLLGEISTDTRTLRPGDVFVALCGENFDGHGFVQQAVDKGAGALIVQEKPAGKLPGVPVILVEDTLQALGDLAAYRRRLWDGEVKVIAITGSSGKTTVKEMTAAIFKHFYAVPEPAPNAVLKTKGNLNNLIGLPLSLLRLTGEHRVAVLEMGMNRPGEIAGMTEIADPDIGCINNIQAAHLEGLGTIEGVAKAKGELFAGLKDDAVFVVNYDDPLVVKLAGKYRGVKIGYAVTSAGRRRGPVVRVTRITGLGEAGSRFTLRIGDWQERLHLPVPGIHNIHNAAAAAAIAHAAGVDTRSIVQGLVHFQNVDNRMQFMQVGGGLRVLNDSYNANPSSMAAALRTVATFTPKYRRVAALGDMLELGENAAAAHREVGRLTASLGYDMLAVTGEYRAQVIAGAREGGMPGERVMSFVDTIAMADWLYHLLITGRLSEDDWLLVKGSRGMRMENLLVELQNRFDPARAGG
ncbi:MAG TPA: UDP-N-acetylmuramyl-tripeptide synthetase [Desulfobulbaceae bacterium]|nr:UDP-N-acetylmuramyl-tripeptide synthetase [Desulfobulbaceae bacterium]